MKKVKELIGASASTVISVFCEVIGVLCWVIGLSFQDESLLFVFVNAGFCIVGSILIWGAIKINPERIHRIMNDDGEPEKEERHNYSPDFEKLYQYTVDYKVERIVESVRKEKISDKQVM